MAPLKPYAGLSRKLVLGIDIGTTFSGVSYTILDPGEVPKVQGVTRYASSFTLRIDAYQTHHWRTMQLSWPGERRG